MKRFHWFLTAISSLLFTLLLSALLYNRWFDTLDRIKYDPTYSPEFDTPAQWKNYVFYAILFV